MRRKQDEYELLGRYGYKYKTPHQLHRRRVKYLRLLLACREQITPGLWARDVKRFAYLVSHANRAKGRIAILSYYIEGEADEMLY